MKKLSFFLLFVAATALYSQNSIPKKTVTVTGNAIVERQLAGYKALITLSLDEGYYAHPACTNIEEFKANYYQRLADEGFDSTLLKTSSFQFSTYGNQKGNTTLTLETDALSDIEKLGRVKMNGVNAQYSIKYVLPKKIEKTLVKKALEDAGYRAKLVAENSGGKLGQLVSITEVLPQTIIWKTYPQDYEEYAKIVVVYELE